jgi:hypothetical protein
MIDCLIVGDSIAVGTSTYKKDCVSLSKGGINSWQWNKVYIERPFIKDADYNKAIISLGSNDHSGVNTRRELEKLRGTIKSKKVYWIMPAIKPNIQEIVLSIASMNGDSIVYIKGISSDKIHPSSSGYKQIALEVQQ